MSSKKIYKLKSIFTTNGGCGCRPKPTDVIEPQPQSKSSISCQTSCHLPSSFDRLQGGGKSTADDCTSTSFSFNVDTSPHYRHDHTIFSKTVGSCPKIKDSFAVVKDSDDPYQDFRQSMLQMIFEKEIYSGNDLQQLLDCFLKLNSPCHHDVIVQAFIEIWSGGGGKAPEAPPCSSASLT